MHLPGRRSRTRRSSSGSNSGGFSGSTRTPWDRPHGETSPVGAPGEAPEGDFTGNLRDRAAGSSRRVSGGPATARSLERPRAPRVRGRSGGRRGFENSRTSALRADLAPEQAHNPRRSSRGTTAEPAAIRRLQDQSQTQTQTQSQITTSIGAPAFGGSPTTACGKPADRGREFSGRGPATTSRGTSRASSPTRRASTEAFGDPGPKVRRWARDFFTKYQPHDRGAIRGAFGSFVVWTSLERARSRVGPVARRVDLARALQHGEGEGTHSTPKP